MATKKTPTKKQIKKTLEDAYYAPSFDGSHNDLVNNLVRALLKNYTIKEK